MSRFLFYFFFGVCVCVCVCVCVLGQWGGALQGSRLRDSSFQGSKAQRLPRAGLESKREPYGFALGEFFLSRSRAYVSMQLSGLMEPTLEDGSAPGGSPSGSSSKQDREGCSAGRSRALLLAAPRARPMLPSRARKRQWGHIMPTHTPVAEWRVGMSALILPVLNRDCSTPYSFPYEGLLA